MRRLLALALLLASTHALAQTPGAAVITGRVLAAADGVPLRRARVQLTGRNASPTSGASSVLTDDDGRFSIEVPGGLGPAAALTISKGGYVTAAPVVRRENLNTPIELRLTRGAAITGIVLDMRGMPAQGYSVTVRRVGANPERDGAPAQYSGMADDRGEYRIGGLVSGTYDVAAGAQSPLMELVNGKVQVREGGLGAVVQVRVDAGDEIGGVQLVAPLRTPAEEAALQVKAAQKPVAPPRGSAAIVRGRVLTAARTPIRGAAVHVLGAPGAVSARTDDNGFYEVRGLRAGRYTVEASVNSQMAWRHGQDRLGQAGRPVTVATDQTVEGIDVVLPAGRAISGVVLDEHGEPIQGAMVLPLQVQYQGDRLVATQVGLERFTDDRGGYRLWGLYEGTYLVQASITGVVSGANRQTTYSTLYYPGSPTVAGAQRINLREDSIANIVFAPITLSEVSGVALDGDAQLVAGRARLIEARQQGLVSSPRTDTIRPDGTFRIPHVPPGNYVLQILGDGPGRTGLFAAQELSVGQAPVRVTVKTSHGTAVEGRLVIEGTVEPVRCELSSIILSGGGAPIDMPCLSSGSMPFQIASTALDDRARVDATMAVIGRTEFFLSGLFGPTGFSLRLAPADDWYLKSFTINGVDISDTGFDFGAQPATVTDSQIVLSRNGASISGQLRESASDSYFVVAFSTSREQRFAYSRRVKFARAGTDGTFRIGGLPPGDYFVAAVDHLEGSADGGEWQNPELLLRLEPGAERITLLEGQAGTVALRLNQR